MGGIRTRQENAPFHDTSEKRRLAGRTNGARSCSAPPGSTRPSARVLFDAAIEPVSFFKTLKFAGVLVDIAVKPDFVTGFDDVWILVDVSGRQEERLLDTEFPAGLQNAWRRHHRAAAHHEHRRDPNVGIFGILEMDQVVGVRVQSSGHCTARVSVLSHGDLQ